MTAVTQMPERPLDPDYRIVALRDGPVTDADVLAFWEREGALSGVEARQRVQEVLLVATTLDGAIAGVSSAHVRGSVPMRVDCWYFRVFVSSRHRHSNVAVQLAVQSRQLLEERFTSRADMSGIGLVYEIENSHLMHAFTNGVWPQTQVAFIGEDRRGSHIRVRYFPGAVVVPTAGEEHVGRVPARMDSDQRIDVVRGKLSAEVSQEILEFWAAHGALTGDAARARLPEVVCVARDAHGSIVGVSSAFDAVVELIGGRRFWVFRRFAPGLSEHAEMELMRRTFEALDGGWSPGEPVGLCVIIDDPDVMRRHPLAVWPGTELFHAGYLPDGRQLRLRYFADAHIA